MLRFSAPFLHRFLHLPGRRILIINHLRKKLHRVTLSNYYYFHFLGSVGEEQAKPEMPSF